jgi:hemerythrin-like domain-containing protein
VAAPVSRRRVLLAGVAGAGLVVGAGAAEAGNLLSASASATISPGEDLMREHGVLKRVLLVYRAASEHISGGQALPVTAVVRGATLIRDYIEGFHESLEEQYVFPRLLAAKVEVPTVNTLLEQHGRGRTITERVLALTTGKSTVPVDDLRILQADLDSFVRMYEPHEAREDTIVFPALRALLSADALHDLGARFTEIERRQFGGDAFARVVDEVAAIEALIGIADLAQFTPPLSTPQP